MLDLKNLRKEYHHGGLHKKDLNLNPFIQFEIWFQDAVKEEILEPNALTLATSTLAGRPSSRTVLLKGINSDGLIFFTNLESRKGKELSENPYASMTFPWLKLQRQVNVEGIVERLSKKQSANYFKSRPRSSQIGAWASHQDQSIESREVLENEFILAEKRFEGKDIPLPTYWGGYRLIPSSFEFLQCRENRLHDRFQYNLNEQGQWEIVRLSP